MIVMLNKYFIQRGIYHECILAATLTDNNFDNFCLKEKDDVCTSDCVVR